MSLFHLCFRAKHIRSWICPEIFRRCMLPSVILWGSFVIIVATVTNYDELDTIPFENCTSTNLIHLSDDVLKNKLQQYGVHYNIQSVLDVLRHSKFRSDEAVQVLMLKYEEAKQVSPKFLPEPLRRHPIIAVDGFFTHGRAMITKMISNSLNGRRLQLPTRNINRLRKYFNNDVLRKHFYSLSKYLGAHVAMHYCRTAPVILERYWHDQAVYVMARSFEGLIPAKSTVYEFPKDLLRPDFIFFINGALNPKLYNESTASRHIHNALTVKMVEVYRRMRNPAPIEIFPPSMPEVMGQKMLDILEEKMKGNFCPKPDRKPIEN
ncbi:UMP kinase activity protein [Homalodisca vitripennis]|nr:UMP kinase activity protein [Homalodisca vitripennis]